ncbi:uncharacterized protein LOC110863876 [Helianthus annuus]|uniref:uncharacterized protein LOC110863876 n=1 Tax=Helianthus annuus TaxID=4232 RepID=UPI001652EADA|nr:uncharacterized protein LOC110863876 [Helianthus annuus]
MPYENWLRTIEGFRQEKYIKKARPVSKYARNNNSHTVGGHLRTVAPPIKIIWIGYLRMLKPTRTIKGIGLIRLLNKITGTYNRPQMNGAAMVLQLPCIKKRWESGDDDTAGGGLNLLPTRPRTRPQTCRLRKLGRKNPFPRILLTACSKLRHFLANLTTILLHKGKEKESQMTTILMTYTIENPRKIDLF